MGRPGGLSHWHGRRLAGADVLVEPEQVGGVIAVHRALERYHEPFGVDYFTIRFRMPTGPPMEAAREQILRFGEEVVQPIHKKYPAPDHPAIPQACRW